MDLRTEHANGGEGRKPCLHSEGCVEGNHQKSLKTIRPTLHMNDLFISSILCLSCLAT